MNNYKLAFWYNVLFCSFLTLSKIPRMMCRLKSTLNVRYANDLLLKNFLYTFICTKVTFLFLFLSGSNQDLSTQDEFQKVEQVFKVIDSV